MYEDIEEILFNEEEISRAADEIAFRINRDYEGKHPVIIGVLKGSFIFLADLVRRLDIDFTVDFIKASSYGDKTRSSGNVDITYHISADIRNRDVIVVEDILDTGYTLSYITEYLRGFSPHSIRICTLFDKPGRRVVPIKPDYTGFVTDDLFIVGYGLDYNEKYRGMPCVGVPKTQSKK